MGPPDPFMEYLNRAYPIKTLQKLIFLVLLLGVLPLANALLVVSLHLVVNVQKRNAQMYAAHILSSHHLSIHSMLHGIQNTKRNF